MPTLTHHDAPTGWAGTVHAFDGSGTAASDSAAPGVILICEHASNRVSPPWDTAAAEMSPGVMASHAASDPGALGLAMALGAHLAQARFGAEVIAAPLSRLIYDLNRSPDRPDACPAQTEIYHIALNDALTPADRLTRMEALYLPFHNLVRHRVARALALGRRPMILTIHSFSPHWHGTPRAVEFGVIHDALPDLASQIVAQSGDLGLVTQLNEPYSAADHVTHTLRLHALPYGLHNAMLEVRNDLIATPDAQTAMAARLAPVLARAMATLSEAPCPAH